MSIFKSALFPWDKKIHIYGIIKNTDTKIIYIILVTKESGDYYK